MVWFKVDDSFWSHPKVLSLSGDALALWVRAGSYCGQQLTDGFVSVQALRMLAERDAAVELTNAGLWEAVKGGFQFHDWAEYQPTREYVITERAKAAERKRQERQRKSRAASQRDSRGTDAVIGGAPSAPQTRAVDPATLDPFCPKHMPKGPAGRSCRACGDAKIALVSAQAAVKSKPTSAPFSVAAGSVCPRDDHQWLPDGTCTRCTVRKGAA